MKKLLIVLMILTSIIYAKDRRIHDFAYVTKSEPIYEYRYDRVYEECEDNYYRNDYRTNEYYNPNEFGLDTIVGATIGVAIGNQIGKGNGKDVARVAGGILGAVIANNTREQRDYSYNKRQDRVYNDCNDGYYTQRKTKVLVGYKNYFTYERENYVKITKRPKHKIKVTKTISF